MSKSPIDLSQIGPDTPLRLEMAAEIAFPGGGMTAKGLRRERDRGRLVVERIAGKEYTTLSAIDKMRELCRVKPKAAPLPDPSIAQAALRHKLAMLKEQERSNVPKEALLAKLAARKAR